MSRPRVPLANRLRHRVDILEANRVDNRRGGRKVPEGEQSWRTIAGGVYAEVIPLRGDEAVRHSIERSVQVWRVTTRFRTDVTTQKRLVWGSITMDIKSAAPNADRTELVMTCESGALGS